MRALSISSRDAALVFVLQEFALAMSTRYATTYKNQAYSFPANCTCQEEALIVADEFTTRARELQTGPGMPPDDVEFMAAKVKSGKKGIPFSASLLDNLRAAGRVSVVIPRIVSATLTHYTYDRGAPKTCFRDSPLEYLCTPPKPNILRQMKVNPDEQSHGLGAKKKRVGNTIIHSDDVRLTPLQFETRF